MVLLSRIMLVHPVVVRVAACVPATDVVVSGTNCEITMSGTCRRVAVR